MSDIQIIDRSDARYPTALKAVSNPPQQLYIRGNCELLAEKRLLAVVGARKASAYGRLALAKLVGPLVSAGTPLVSGLAFGIDAYAAKLCIDKQVPTIAVLGSGCDDATLYPQAHIRLAHDIIAGGGTVVSEYAPGTPGTPHRFPERNRIIAGLCSLTLVVQAQERSGSLITARLALEAGRDVAVVPGSVTDPLSLGTNKLLRDGALPIVEPEDLLTYFELDGLTKQKPAPNLSPEQQILFNALAADPRHIEEVAASVERPVSAVSATLTELELQGRVENVGAQRYVRR